MALELTSLIDRLFDGIVERLLSLGVNGGFTVEFESDFQPTRGFVLRIQTITFDEPRDAFILDLYGLETLRESNELTQWLPWFDTSMTQRLTRSWPGLSA